MPTQITVSHVRELDRNPWARRQALYRLSEPVSYGFDWETQSFTGTTEHVIVSSITTPAGPETFIFPARADGSPLDYLEMPGSAPGSWTHEQALRRAGWTPDPDLRQ